MSNPRDTVKLLDALQKRGFTDNQFSRLHHLSRRGRVATIQAHRYYCSERISEFQENGTNVLVQRRLILLLAKYESLPPSELKPDVFPSLIEKVLAEIPIR